MNHPLQFTKKATKIMSKEATASTIGCRCSFSYVVVVSFSRTTPDGVL